MLSFLFLYLALSVQSTAGQDLSEDFTSRIFQTIETRMQQENIKGLSMALVMPDGDVVLKGFGFSDFERQQKITPATIFPVASLTKTLTVIAIMQLVQQGKLALNDPVQVYLPDFYMQSRFDETPEATINDLLSHYGGIPRDIYKGLMALNGNGRPDLVKYLQGQFVSFPPGVKYSYSNLGYELLGLIIEAITNIPYKQYVLEKVLGPMKMHNSFFLTHKAPSLPVSKAYVNYEDAAHDEFPIHLTSSGGLYSSAEDFSSLLQWLLVPGMHSPLVHDSLVIRMFTDQKTELALDVSFQSGWSWILESYPEPFRGHFAYLTGNTLHFNSVLAVAPHYGLGVVLFSNTSGAYQPVLDLAREIIFSTVEQQTGYPVFPNPVDSDRSVVAPDPGIADLARGDFLLEGNFLQIFSLQDQVILKFGEEAFKLFYNPDGWFTLNEEYRFKTRQIHNNKVLYAELNGFILPIATDVLRGYNLSDALNPWLGTYYIANVDPLGEELFYKQLDLEVKDNILQATFHLGDYHQKIFVMESSTHNLIPTPDGHAVFAGFGMYQGETLFLNKDEKGYCIHFSGLEFQKPNP